MSEKLLATAKLLYSQMEGCVVNHHGIDFEEQGLPGWLVDCKADIDAAEIALSALHAKAGVRVKGLEWEIAKADKSIGELREYYGYWVGGYYLVVKREKIWIVHTFTNRGKARVVGYCPTLEAAKAAAQADYDARIRSALSTKLQEPVGELHGPYWWEGERPPEVIIHQVINKYMGEKDREYDNDQFKYYLNNWHGHAELNRRMREAFPLAALKSEDRK